MRGIVNETYLDDLREKTLRGQKGRKARGFTVGDATYGYRSVPAGDMRVDRRGRPRPDGHRMVIEPSEAEVALRIVREFSEGKAIKALVEELNAEQVRGRRKLSRGSSPSSVSRILKNEKDIRRSTWDRTETRRDPKTGQKRRVLKPESEWHVPENEQLRIVPQELWERVAARWKEVDRARGALQKSLRDRSAATSKPIPSPAVSKPSPQSRGSCCAGCSGPSGWSPSFPDLTTKPKPHSGSSTSSRPRKAVRIGCVDGGRGSPPPRI